MEREPSGRGSRWRFAAIVAVLAFVGAGPFPRDWFTTCSSASSSAEAEVDGAIRSIRGSRSPLPIRAGVASVNLGDGFENLPLAGYGKRAFRPSEGVADPVEAKVILLETASLRVAIVAVDLLLVSPSLVAETLAALPPGEWSREQLFFCATHTHAAPGGFVGSYFAWLGTGLFRPDVVATLGGRIADAIVRADQEKRDAEGAWIAIETPEGFDRNRTREEDPPNRWLDLLLLRKTDGSPLATVGIFCAHATCRHSSDRRVSADYPGKFRRAIEHELGGQCTFLAGAVGSMAPGGFSPREFQDALLGGHLSQVAVTAIDEAAPKYEREISLATTGLRLPMPTPQVKFGRDWRLSPILGGAIAGPTGWTHGLRIGDRVLLGTPADYGGTLAEELRDREPGRTFVVTSFSGDYVGYVLPSEYDDLPSYEPERMSLYGPRFGESYTELLERLGKGLGR